MTYTLCFARGIKLSCEVPFVKFQWLVLKLPAANQRVSNSVFFVSSYILVLRFNLLLRARLQGKGCLKLILCEKEKVQV